MKNKLFLTGLTGVLLLFLTPLWGQSPTLNLQYKDTPVVQVLEDLESKTNYSFVYQKQVLAGVPGLQINQVPENVRFNYAYYPVVFDGWKYPRDEVYARLAEQDIIARKYFYPLTNAFECYQGVPGFDPQDTPVAAHIADRVLTLPMYADLPLEKVDQICDIILG